MEKEFVPYEIALKLKELGFDKPCLGVYYTKDGHVRKCEGDEIGDAPLYQQVFRWFREEYNINQIVDNSGSLTKVGHWAYVIFYDAIYSNDGYLNYEEAELACINKLIELVEKPKL